MKINMRSQIRRFLVLDRSIADPKWASNHPDTPNTGKHHDIYKLKCGIFLPFWRIFKLV